MNRLSNKDRCLSLLILKSKQLQNYFGKIKDDFEIPKILPAIYISFGETRFRVDYGSKKHSFFLFVEEIIDINQLPWIRTKKSRKFEKILEGK